MYEPDEILKLHKRLLSQPFAFFPADRDKMNASIEQGVYIIYSSKNKVLHVGKSSRGKKGIRQLLKNHLSNKSSFSKKYLKPHNINLRNGYKFKYLEVPNARTRTFLEALASGILCPAHIGTGEKRMD